MLKKFGLVIAAMLLPLLSWAQSDVEFKAGVHYETLAFPVKTTDANRIEVVEAFGYPCPHCNSFEPLLEHWNKSKAEDVNFVRIPVVFGRSWEPMARAYYVAEVLKAVEQTHGAMFNAVHVERRRFAGKEQLAEFYGNLGVDPVKFAKLYDSFTVDTKLKQGDSKLRGYGVTGVPSMVVNGKYRVTAQMAGSHEKMLEVVNFLIAQERAATQQ